MGYVVEDVSVEDRKKILVDTAYEPRFEKRFMSWFAFLNPESPYARMRWAIDRDNNNYLFRSESFARELGNGYHFFFNGKLYELGINHLSEPDGGSAVEVHSIEQAGELKTLSSGFKEELAAAFREYGLQGHGDLDVRGMSGCSVVPVFGGEG